MHLNLLDNNTEALELLDWSLIIKDLTSFSHFEHTKNFFQAPPAPLLNLDIEKSHDQISFFCEFKDDLSIAINQALRSLPSTADKFQAVYDLKKGKMFEVQDLNFFGRLLENYLEFHSLFKDLPHQPEMTQVKAKLLLLRKSFLRPLRDLVDSSGNVSYEKHPLLSKKFRSLLLLEDQLRTNIQLLAKKDPFKNHIQMDTFDIVNDRYVLALKSDSYQGNLGQIIARSQSGMTLYVEPFELKEKVYERIHLKNEIETIILKLTHDLSKTAQLNAQEFHDLLLYFVFLDQLQTKAEYSTKHHLVKPTLSHQFEIDITGIFHPLIPHSIKNDLHIHKNQKGIVISGPNTGGKTVLLKSTSLLILFLHMGLFLPCDKAHIYPIHSLFYFSHDHQNLSAGLSSFASESKYYLELLKSLNEHNLIVIDEIFNSTSSEEASALAISFLEEIHRLSQSKILISTHHQVLKTFMHGRTDYISGHMGFDFEHSKPTYKFISGEPGSSLAFKIFEELSKKFEYANDIGLKAQSMLDKKHITYEALLQDLSYKKGELDKIHSENKRLNLELKNQKSSMEGILFLEKEKELLQFNKKLQLIFKQAEELLSQVKEDKISSKKILGQKILSIENDLPLKKKGELFSQQKIEQDQYSNLPMVLLDQLKTPTTLYSLSLKKNVKAIQVNLDKREVKIQHANFTLWAPIHSLRHLQQDKIPQKVQVHVNRTIKGEIEVDCRGMRLEQFQNACFQAIDEVITGEIPFVTIIHGHGDGILKNWLRMHLKKNYRDLKWDNVEGNDGCTKIYI